MSKVALCVGIDYYENANCLNQCVKDAYSVAKVLDRNGDGSKNFDETIPMFATDEKSAISGDDLEAAVERLFGDDHEIALFYFAGHGAVNAYGGYLCSSDVARPKDGLSMDTLMKIVKRSPAKNKIIILDSCHSGALGKIDVMDNYCQLPNNTTILAACTEDDVAFEGVFTPLLVDALTGGAMNLVGEVSPGSIYSYIDRALGVWYQHPVFKANIKNFVCIRKNKPPIDLAALRRITEIFKYPEPVLPLDPSYEEDKRDVEDKEHDLEHEKIFAILRKYAALNLVVPVDEEYMYWAAIHSKSCKLTAQGRYYWELVKNGRI